MTFADIITTPPEIILDDKGLDHLWETVQMVAQQNCADCSKILLKTADVSESELAVAVRWVSAACSLLLGLDPCPVSDEILKAVVNSGDALVDALAPTP